jgi:hypothetical protein
MKAAPTLTTTNMTTTTLDANHGQRLIPSQTVIPGTDRPAQLREYVDSVVLDALIKHPDLTEYRKTLESYRDTGRGGERIVTYAPSASAHNRGRYYADKGLSMQSFPRRIRHTLAKTIDGVVLYHDIDMVNAHPVLLSQICELFFSFVTNHPQNYLKNTPKNYPKTPPKTTPKTPQKTPQNPLPYPKT